MRLDIENINVMMDIRKIRPKELAKRLNKSDSWTYLMLQGKAGRTFKIVEQLAKAIGCLEVELVEFKRTRRL